MDPVVIAILGIASGSGGLIAAVISYRRFNVEKDSVRWEGFAKTLTAELSEQADRNDALQTRLDSHEARFTELHRLLDAEREARRQQEVKTHDCENMNRALIREMASLKAVMAEYIEGGRPR